jgi:phenylalanyl-tRNA synthetase beta chain
MEFTNDEIRNILEGLGLKVTMVNGTFIADIPTWRLDLRQEIDLIEELARIKGYENVPVTVMPVVPRLDESKHIKPAEEILRERLIGLGFCEAMNYSFAQESELRGFGLNVSVRIANPLSKENEVLRPSLIAGLWKNFNLNINQGFSAIKLFETGNIFPETGERKSLGFVVYGPVWPEWWGWEARKITVPKIDFYFLNGIAIALFNGNTFSITSSGSYLPFLHPGKSALFELNGRPVGQFGILRPEYGNGLTGEIGYGEFDLDAVEKCWNRQVPQYHALRRYPPVKRDISLLARKDIPFDKIMKVINDFIIQGSLLREFNLFSIYEDEKIGTDKISYSFHLIFRHPEHTLKDAEVNAQTEGILERLARELGVTLRA